MKTILLKKEIQSMVLTSVFLNLIICLTLLIYQWKQNKAIIYVASLILLVNIRQIIMLLINEPLEDRVLATLLVHFDPLVILIGPMLLYYYKSLIQGKFVFDKWLWLYLIPISLIFINTIPYYLLDFESKIQFAKMIKQNPSPDFKIPRGTWLIDYNIQMKIIPIHNWAYIIYSFFYLFQEKKKNSIKAKVSKIITRLSWIIFIVWLPMLLQVLFATLHAKDPFDLSFQDSTISSDFMYLATLILPLSFFLYPSWLYGSANTSTSVWEKFKEMWSSISRIALDEKLEKPEKSADLDRILRYLDTKKPYLNATFSVHDVSRELNIPHLRVSNSFNKQLETTFPEYRNKLRIEYAVGLLKENAHFQMSIEGIAVQSGFKNKSSFYAAFRAVHQMTPTEWISKNLG
jgi:AraC-like DNA-binding protein